MSVKVGKLDLVLGFEPEAETFPGHGADDATGPNFGHSWLGGQQKLGQEVVQGLISNFDLKYPEQKLIECGTFTFSKSFQLFRCTWGWYRETFSV